MSAIRTVLSSATRGSQFFSLSSKSAIFQPSTKFSYRSFSTLAGKIVCQCGAELPKTEEILRLYKERNLRAVNYLVNCKQLRSYDFVRRIDCEHLKTA